MKELVEGFSNLEVGLRVRTLDNDLIFGSVDFDTCNEDPVTSELAHFLAKIVFAFFIKLLQSELKHLLFL